MELLLANFPFFRSIDLSLILALYVATRSLPVKSALTACLFGLIHDGSFGFFLGIHGMSRTLIGFSASHLSQRVAVESVPSRPLTIALLSAVDSLMVFAMLHSLGLPIGEGFWMSAAVRAGVTGVVGEVVFQVYDKFRFPPKDFRRLEL